MFAWKEKRDTKTKIDKLLAGHAEHTGANRRAIGLVPVPKHRDLSEVTQSNHLKHQQLLVAIEGSNQTCCLRVVSPQQKSRAAIMVFRGRVIGCLYGNKQLGHQLFGVEALERAISDLSHQDSILDTYVLPEDLVLAAGALFHGNALLFPPDSTAEQTFESSCEMLMRSNMPGCIVVNNYSDMAVCMVYVFCGHIVGVYSFTDGWVETSYEAGLRYLQANRGGKVLASMLPCHNVAEVMQLSVSLTGLADRSLEPHQNNDRGMSLEELMVDCSVPETEQLKNTLHMRNNNQARKTTQTLAIPGAVPNNAMASVRLSPLSVYGR